MINALGYVNTWERPALHLLRGGADKWRGCLEGYEHWRWVLQEEKRPSEFSDNTQNDRHKKRHHRHLPTSEFEVFFDQESVT